jgi:hypothetical protein
MRRFFDDTVEVPRIEPWEIQMVFHNDVVSNATHMKIFKQFTNSKGKVGFDCNRVLLSFYEKQFDWSADPHVTHASYIYFENLSDATLFKLTYNWPKMKSTNWVFVEGHDSARLAKWDDAGEVVKYDPMIQHLIDQLNKA